MVHSAFLGLSQKELRWLFKFVFLTPVGWLGGVFFCKLRRMLGEQYIPKSIKIKWVIASAGLCTFKALYDCTFQTEASLFVLYSLDDVFLTVGYLVVE